jgi:hypothetical protein
MNSFEINWKDELAKNLLTSYVRNTGLLPDIETIKKTYDSVCNAWNERTRRMKECDEPLEIKER